MHVCGLAYSGLFEVQNGNDVCEIKSINSFGFKNGMEFLGIQAYMTKSKY